ncbi:hypothetical protein SAMN05443248_0535 [Bradyrhizobium erythrophlei]|uniref:Uncharacterized protein n=1 Tax=Bradyrhizobium erythrophlei TaxID=1437360 RepID=A0A1M5HM71_9BRAD|nr:hypothetical protein SAMN05443248_0535 [Bradyrhizobium erythrophlei]
MAYSPEMARPNEHRNPPQVSEVAPADDIRTIMLNQVSWGAVFAGATIAPCNADNSQHGWSRRRSLDHRRSRGGYADCRIPLNRCRYLVGYLRNSCGCGWWLHRWAAFRKVISIDNRLSRFDCVGGFDPNRGLPALDGCLGSDWRRCEHGIVRAWRSRQSHRRVRSNCRSDRSAFFE